MAKFSKHLKPDILPALLYKLSNFFFEPLEVTTTFIFVFQMVILRHEEVKLPCQHYTYGKC